MSDPDASPVTPLLRSLSRLGSPLPEVTAFAVSAKLGASAPVVVGSSDDDENDPDRLAELGAVAIESVPLTLGFVPDAVSMKARVAAPEPLGSVMSDDDENDPDRLAELGVVVRVRVPPTLGLVPDAVSVKVNAAVPEPAGSALSAPALSEDEVNDPDRLAELGVVVRVRVPLTRGPAPDAVSVKVNAAVPEPAGSALSAPALSEDEVNDPDRLAELGVVPIVRVPPTFELVPDAVSVVVKLAVPESRPSVALPGAAASVSVAAGVSVVLSAAALSVPAVAESVPLSIMMPMPLLRGGPCRRDAGPRRRKPVSSDT